MTSRQGRSPGPDSEESGPFYGDTSSHFATLRAGTCGLKPSRYRASGKPEGKAISGWCGSSH